MSRESMTDLNRNTLIGDTLKRGNAWHYVESLQGEESNHYDGAIPVADVERRLFDWEALESEVSYTAITNDGVSTLTVPNQKVLYRSDNGGHLGTHSEGYAGHSYKEWLLKNVSNLLSDTLHIGSAGLLSGGGIAWVQVEATDNVDTPDGVSFRPNILATTSFNGKVATTYKRVSTIVVCDNTLSMARSEKGETFKVKHTKHSALKLSDAKSALHLIEQAIDDESAAIHEACSLKVNAIQFDKFLDLIAPVPTEKGKGQTQAINKQDALRLLWNKDERVSPWNGTYFGVVQMMNTWLHHVSSVRGGADIRSERNKMNAITGKTDAFDDETRRVLDLVMA